MENEKLDIKKTDHYIRYTIPKQDNFSTIEYKVLLNQRENNLLRCSKVTCNGNLQLVYNVQQLQAVSTVIPGTDDEIWKINEKFLDIQTSSGREIYLSHNPEDYIGKGQFYSKELQYLLDNGYRFVDEGGIWHAVR